MSEASRTPLTARKAAHILVQASSLPYGLDGQRNAAGLRHSELVFFVFFVVFFGFIVYFSSLFFLFF